MGSLTDNRPWMAVLALMDGACSPATAPPAQSLVVQTVSPAVEKPVEQQVIVWTKGDGNATSRWLGSSPSGVRVTDEKEGIFVAAENGTWALRTESVEVETQPCDPNEGPSDAPAGEGKAQRLIAESVGGQEMHVVLDPEPDPGANEVMHTVSVLASVGPYLFVKEHVYTYACGAHGGASAKLMVWDLQRHERVELDGLFVSPQMVVEAHATIDDPDAPAEETPSLKFVGVVPRYDDSAELVCGYLFTAFACYTCGSGEWGSYTKHAIVRGPIPTTLTSLCRTARHRSGVHGGGLVRDGWLVHTSDHCSKIELDREVSMASARTLDINHSIRRASHVRERQHHVREAIASVGLRFVPSCLFRGDGLFIQ